MQSQCINAGQWTSRQIGSRIIYSPNQDLLNDLTEQSLNQRFWRQCYSRFVFIIYDLNTHTILAVRDHVGLEPCYYSFRDCQFIFASTLPALLKALPSPPVVNSAEINKLFFNKFFNTQRYSDETYYHGVFRLEPGYELRIDLNRPSSKGQKTIYWDLRDYNKTIYYADPVEYVEHFSALLSEGLRLQIGKETRLAAEFSGGLDSSAVLACAFQNRLQPDLLMHVASPGNAFPDDLITAEKVIRQLGLENIHYIDASQFDLLASMDEYAQYFAGGAPYNGFVLANNVHRTIVSQGYGLVLSGIGGDECASSHAPLKAAIPQIMRQQGVQAAWAALHAHYRAKEQIPPGQLRNLTQLILMAFPRLMLLKEQYANFGLQLGNYFSVLRCDWSVKDHCSIRDYEHNLIQGPASHHLRLRLEYNAVLAMGMGFQYAYPLLYPKLIEFCHQLPLEQKRYRGISRYLIRHYLAQFFSPELFGKQNKSGCVTPGTLEKVIRRYEEGGYDQAFQNLPFKTARQRIKSTVKMDKKYHFMHDIPAYMFQAYWSSLRDK